VLYIKYIVTVVYLANCIPFVQINWTCILLAVVCSNLIITLMWIMSEFIHYTNCFTVFAVCKRVWGKWQPL